jgi:hypothetical protein
LGGRRKLSQRRREGHGRESGWRDGRGEPNLVFGDGKMTEALRTSRKNGNRHPQKVRGGGGGETLQNIPETWEVRDSQDSEEGTLYEMPKSRERELTEPTSSKKTGHKMREGCCHLIVKTLIHNCSHLKELHGWKWR